MSTTYLSEASEPSLLHSITPQVHISVKQALVATVVAVRGVDAGVAKEEDVEARVAKAKEDMARAKVKVVAKGR